MFPLETERLDEEPAIVGTEVASRDAALERLGLKKAVAYVDTPKARSSRRALKEAARKTKLAEKGIRQLNLMTSGNATWRNALGAIAKRSSDIHVVEAVKMLAGDPEATRLFLGNPQPKLEGDKASGKAAASLHPIQNLSEDEAFRLQELLARPAAVSLLSVVQTISDEQLTLIVEAIRGEAWPFRWTNAMPQDLRELIRRLVHLLNAENEHEARLNVRLVLAFLTYPNWRSVFAYLGQNAAARANLDLVLNDETVVALLAGYRHEEATASMLRRLVSPSSEGATPEIRLAAFVLFEAILSDPAIAARLHRGEPVRDLLENLKRTDVPGHPI